MLYNIKILKKVLQYYILKNKISKAHLKEKLIMPESQKKRNVN